MAEGGFATQLVKNSPKRFKKSFKSSTVASEEDGLAAEILVKWSFLTEQASEMVRILNRMHREFNAA